MSNSNQGLDDLSSPFVVLSGIALRTFVVAIACGTLVGFVSLNNITSLVLPIITLLGGWFIYLFSYRITFDRGKERGWMRTGWNHAILIGACLVGGFWSAVVQTSICYLYLSSKVSWLHQFPLQCNGFDSVTERLLTLSMAGIIGFLIVPAIYLLAYILRR